MLDRQTYVVKERVGFMKLASTYDLLDPSGAPIGVAKEKPPGIVKYLRLLVNNKWLPTEVNVYEREGEPAVLTIHRGVALFRPKVHVTARGGQQLGYFQAKVLSIGPSFRIFDTQDREIGMVKGDWKGWNFQLLGPQGQELGRVTKKWAGLGKELFTTADTYVISLSDTRRETAQLLLAAGLAIDTVFKEKDE